MKNLTANIRFFIRILGLAMVPLLATAQPPEPNTPEAPCSPEPAGPLTDTVVSEPDADGYVSLFDGESFTGWWHSCMTRHSNPNTALGAVFKVDPGQKAIYSAQHAGGAGGILMTKKKYEHYELVFDVWPDYGNDAGIFNRTNAKGDCFQTVLDYINGGSVGGTWGEAGYPSRDFRPWAYNGAENNISIPGKPGSDLSNWTKNTQSADPASYGCGTSGCEMSDYLRLWDVNGWNQMKIEFYGGITAATTVKMKSWFRKSGGDTWVPIIADTTLTHATPAGYIGIQVHQGNRFNGSRGNWYRNIKIRPLDENGTPLPPPVTNASAAQGARGITFHHHNISVAVDGPGIHRVRLSDIRGSLLDEKELAGGGLYLMDSKKLRRGVYILQVSAGTTTLSKKYFLQ